MARPEPSVTERPAGNVPDRNLALELVRVTEAATLGAGRWIGRGDKEAADQAAVDGMRAMLDTVSMAGVVVIGEGEKDKAPMLYNGEEIGSGHGPEVDVAVDPLEGTNLTAMGRPKSPTASLLPSDHILDLFVTLTDYHGYHQLVQIHDPPLIYELDHHHVLRFSYRRRPNGEVESDFDLDNAPALAFAARATSSFPGAFPPARIVEMDDLVAKRQARWPRRAEFIERAFHHHLRAGIDPTAVSFIDGAVLNNRPFREAISAIQGRPAYRQVDRRLVYIEPHPAPPAVPRRRKPPGFFSMLRAAMSDIPASQPVTDELSWVVDFNDRVRRLRAIIDSARPQISQLVATVITADFNRPTSTNDLRAWREQVNSQVARDAGFAYQAYVRLKLASVRAFGAQLIVRLRGAPSQSPLSRVVAEIIDAWALAKGIVYERADSEALEFDTPTAEHVPAWVKYLLAFDVKYRERRLHFLVEGQNRLYELLDQERFSGLDPLVVDRLKRAFYGKLDELRRRENVAYYSADVRALVAELFPAAPSASEVKNLQSYARSFVDRHFTKLGQLIEHLAVEIGLNATTRDLDDLFETPRHGATREVRPQQGRDESRGGGGVGPGGDRRGAPPARRARVRGGAGARAQDVGPPASHRYAAAARSGRVPRAPAAGGPRPGRDRAGIARAPRAPRRAVRRGPLAALRGRFRGGAHRPALSRGCDAPRAAGGCAIDASCGELRPLRAAVAQPPRGGGRIHAPQADEDPRPDDQRGT